MNKNKRAVEGNRKNIAFEIFTCKMPNNGLKLQSLFSKPSVTLFS